MSFPPVIFCCITHHLKVSGWKNTTILWYRFCKVRIWRSTAEMPCLCFSLYGLWALSLEQSSDRGVGVGVSHLGASSLMCRLRRPRCVKIRDSRTFPPEDLYLASPFDLSFSQTQWLVSDGEILSDSVSRTSFPRDQGRGCMAFYSQES